MLNTTQVKHSFSKQSNSYEKNNRVQKLAAKHLIDNTLDLYNTDKYSIALDLGCGTGEVSQILSSTTKTIDLDFSYQMLKNNNSDSIKLCSNVSSLPFCSNASFSHVFSSFCLQWLSLKDLNKTLKNTKQFLAKKAIMSFCLPISGSFKEISDCNTGINCDFRFIKLHSEGEINEIIKNLGFNNIKTETSEYKMQYKDLINFLKTIKKSGAGYKFNKKNKNITKKKVKKVSDILFKKYDNFITWKVLNCYLLKI